MPRRGGRVRRRLDLARRLAVPQLEQHRALHGLPLRRGRAVRRRALSDAAGRDHRGLAGKSSGGYGAMVVRCSDPTYSARSLRTPATRCSSAATCPSSRGRRAGAARPLRGLLRGVPRAAAAGRPLRLVAAWRRSRCTWLLRTAPIRRDPARRCCRSRSRPGGWSTRCGSGGSQWDPVRMAPGHADALREHAPDLSRRRPERRVLPRSRRPGVRGRARQARGRAHARAVRRHARRHQLSLSRGRSASWCSRSAPVRTRPRRISVVRGGSVPRRTLCQPYGDCQPHLRRSAGSVVDEPGAGDGG